MRGTHIAPNQVVLRLFGESPFDSTSITASKKTRTAIAIALQAILTLNEVVDDRLIKVALHETNISATTFNLCLFSYIRFAHYKLDFGERCCHIFNYE